MLAWGPDKAAAPRLFLVSSDRRKLLLLGGIETELLDVSQEAEESAHLLAAHSRRQVGDLDHCSPRYSAHCANDKAILLMY